MKRLRKLVTFSLDDRAFTLYVSAVIRIIRVIDITSLDNQEKLNHEKQTQA